MWEFHHIYRFPPTLQGNYAQAGSLYWRAAAISETVLGPEHPSVAAAFNNLAELLRAQVGVILIFQEGNIVEHFPLCSQFA